MNLRSGQERSAEAPWFAGRVARRFGTRALVDVLATMGEDGRWRPVSNPRKLFPRLGQVELHGVDAISSKAGGWLAFQIAPSPRPGTGNGRIGAHRPLPFYAEMTELGTSEAARQLFVREGWRDHRAGLWAVRISDDRVLVLELAWETDRMLRVPRGSRKAVACYAFDETSLMPDPADGVPAALYELAGDTLLGTYDWSDDADYIARVVRSLAGDDDGRVADLIAWLELHRDGAGSVTLPRDEAAQAFEAIRSGDLAERLAADQRLRAAYLAAVGNQPAVARALAIAAEEAVGRDREAERAAIRHELTIERDAAIAALGREIDATKRAQLRELEVRRVAATAELQAELEALRVDIRSKVEAESTAARDELEAQIAALTLARDGVAYEITALRGDQAALSGAVTDARIEIERLERVARTLRHSAGAVAAVPVPIGARTPLPGMDFAATVARSPLLTSQGKALVGKLVALMLAGELPVLNGSQVDDLLLVVAATVAAGSVVTIECDPTILTVEDLWSRPGSGAVTPLAQAAAVAAQGGGPFLVTLRRIERSGARFWWPALAAYTRAGLLPRSLLVCTTVENAAADEVVALPSDACRLTVDGAMAPGAGLVAPALLGGGAAALSCMLDAGERPADLSGALPIMAELGHDLGVAEALRAARLGVETMRLNGGDRAVGLAAARDLAAAFVSARSKEQSKGASNA
jgi:hypothetical protein